MDSMAPKDGTRGQYPRGKKVQMTPEWKQSVDSWLEGKGLKRTWLAQKLKVSDATISRTLDLDGAQTSALVPKICDVTGLAPPMAAIQTSAQQRLLEILKNMTESETENVIEYTQFIRSKRSSPKKGD